MRRAACEWHSAQSQKYRRYPQARGCRLMYKNTLVAAPGQLLIVSYQRSVLTMSDRSTSGKASKADTTSASATVSSNTQSTSTPKSDVSEVPLGGPMSTAPLPFDFEYFVASTRVGGPATPHTYFNSSSFQALTSWYKPVSRGISI